MEEIKALWRRLFGDDNPTHNRQFLERRIAYRLQENAFRQVDPSLLERDPARKPKADLQLMPGTVLTREYRGVEHRVTVGQDGQYEFQGRRYPSLSRIAREITGTRWSGPVFFGVKAPSPPTRPVKGGRR